MNAQANSNGNALSMAIPYVIGPRVENVLKMSRTFVLKQAILTRVLTLVRIWI